MIKKPKSTSPTATQIKRKQAKTSNIEKKLEGINRLEKGERIVMLLVKPRAWYIQSVIILIDLKEVLRQELKRALRVVLWNA
jgi:hypothetical protein